MAGAPQNEHLRRTHYGATNQAAAMKLEREGNIAGISRDPETQRSRATGKLTMTIGSELDGVADHLDLTLTDTEALALFDELEGGKRRVRITIELVE